MKLFFVLIYYSLFKSKGTIARLTARRVKVLLVMIPWFILVEIVTWFCFLLDDIFFRGYKKIKIEQPLFLMGMPRSGTSFFQNLISRDAGKFTGLATWESFFAPSVTQKKFFRALRAIDRRFGGHLYRKLEEWDYRVYSKSKLGRLHKFSWLKPEEDDPVLIHIFSSIYIIFMFPFTGFMRSIGQFDEKLPAKERARIMRFYKRCAQCHMYVYGQGKRFMAKNPNFCVKVKSLVETFPDANLVNLFRNPLESVPSSISMMPYFYELFCDTGEEYAMKKATINMAKYYFYYSLSELDKLPPEKYAIIKYDDLVAEPDRVAREIYDRFGYEISPEYAKVLEEEAEKARRYESKHTYSLSHVGLTKEGVIKDFKFVFDRFGFDTQGEEVDEPASYENDPEET